MSWFNPNNWYWSVQDSSPGTQVWQSSSGTFVVLANADYVAFLAAGNTATPIDTLANFLRNPLDSFNQSITPPPFLAVTSAVNYQLANTPPRLLYFTPTATGLTVKLPQMNLFGSLAMGRELLIYNAGGIPISVADVNGLGLMTPFGVLPGNALFSIHLTANTSTGGTFATAIILFPIEQSIGDSNTGLGNFSNESLITVFPLNAALTVPRTWTLPLAASCVQGSFILIKDNTGGISATNTLSVARNGADTINGAATSIVLNRAYDYLLLETDGISKWTIVGGKGSLASTDLSDLPIPVASGGTGASSFTNHAVLLGTGTSPISVTAPATVGRVLLDQGAAADPSFGALDLANTNARTGTLPVANGGTAQTTGDYTPNGSWTPSDQSGAGLTFSSVTVAYSRVGNMVFVYGRFTFPATADGSNTLIGGLPVTVPNSLKAQNLNIAFTNAGLAAPLAAVTIANTTTFQLVNMISGARVTNANLSGAAVSFNIMYPAV